MLNSSLPHCHNDDTTERKSTKSPDLRRPGPKKRKLSDRMLHEKFNATYDDLSVFEMSIAIHACLYINVT